MHSARQHGDTFNHISVAIAQANLIARFDAARSASLLVDFQEVRDIVGFIDLVDPRVFNLPRIGIDGVGPIHRI